MKEVHWIGSRLNDLRAMPEGVKEEAGFAIYQAQQGGKAINTVSMTGFGGASVLEVVISEAGNAYRAVYTVKFEAAVYVLHVFQKKSNRGIATPLQDLRLIKARLRDAEKHYQEHYVRKKQEKAHGAQRE